MSAFSVLSCLVYKWSQQMKNKILLSSFTLLTILLSACATTTPVVPMDTSTAMGTPTIAATSSAETALPVDTPNRRHG